MTRKRGPLAALVLHTALAGPAAATTEYTQYDSLLYAPIAGEPDCRALAPLSIPSTWMAGDAGAVVLSEQGPPEAWRHATVAALIGEGAAVFEIVAGAPTDCGRRAARDPRDEVPAAVAALRERGAGLIVALGFGDGTGAVLAAGPDVAAVAHVAAGGVAFRAGAPVPPEEGWARRSALFCALLGETLAQPQYGWPDREATRTTCDAALVVPVAGLHR